MLVEAFVPHPFLEALGEGVSDIAPGKPTQRQSSPAAWSKASTAEELNSVLLLLTIAPCRPGRAISAFTSRTTVLPEREMSGTAVRHSS